MPSLTFFAKFWWAYVHSRLHLAGNDNTLSLAYANLVTYIMAHHGINTGHIISTEMHNRALNDKAGLRFPCLLTKLCYDIRVSVSKYLDERITVTKAVNLALIKDVNNSLFLTYTTRPARQYAFSQAPP